MRIFPAGKERQWKEFLRLMGLWLFGCVLIIILAETKRPGEFPSLGKFLGYLTFLWMIVAARRSQL